MKTFIINFSRSEYEMHIPIFKILFPGIHFEYVTQSDLSDGLTEKKITKDDHVLVGCIANEKDALEAIGLLKEKKCGITLYSERTPSVLFLTYTQKLKAVSLLYCPESMDELRKCSEYLLSNKRYLTKAAQNKRASEELNRFVDYDSLNEINKLLLFCIFEGLSVKDMAILTQKSVQYIQTCITRLKEKFDVLEKRELFFAMIRWINVSTSAADTRKVHL